VYENFHVLLDSPAPASTLGLNFDDYASALSEIVEASEPQFAVGIFGAWGSGKTTLMRAVEDRLLSGPSSTPGVPLPPSTAASTIVTVWFNAWRYEKEVHLIVPLLDTVREALVAWADKHPSDDAVREGRIIHVAAVMARAARALLSGFSISAGLPGGLAASIDANKVVAAWGGGADATRAAAEEPLSFYHASFTALREAVNEFSQHGARRIVIFVDDLDRCLPEKALDVLESMKLFFDLSGFVFVVGLDQGVIERAVQLKYRSTPTDDTSYVSGINYVKKIFQVPFSVPRISQAQLGEFLEAVVQGGDLPDAQIQDLRNVVSRHLPALVGDSTLNPREVKRFINSYTIQMKMLERKLGSTNVRPDVVLGLQALNFRAQWTPLYELLAADPRDAQQALTEAVSSGDSVVSADPTPVALPQAARLYLQGEGAQLLTEDLDVYVSSLESSISTSRVFGEALGAVRRARLALSNQDSPSEITASVQSLLQHQDAFLGMKDSPAGNDIIVRFSSLRQLADTPPASAEDGAKWVSSIGDQLSGVETDLRELRRASGVGATSAA
jgi:KAP family P-loop domain